MANDELHAVLTQTIKGFPEVLLVYLFGSQVTGQVGPMSDFDFAVLLESPADRGEILPRLSSALAAQLGGTHIDTVSLDNASPELAFAVISDGEVLYQRDVDTRVEYEARVMSVYYDYLPVLRLARLEILDGGEHAARVQRYREALGRTERTLRAIRTDRLREREEP